jgi:hypothetical protein
VGSIRRQENPELRIAGDIGKRQNPAESRGVVIGRGIVFSAGGCRIDASCRSYR